MEPVLSGCCPRIRIRLFREFFLLLLFGLFIAFFALTFRWGGDSFSTEIGRAVSRQLLVGIIVSRFRQVPTIGLVGFSYLQEGVFNAECIFFFSEPRPPRPGVADLARFARLT